eukprot:COSAG05_NODE_2850_length_2573_cov_2.078011_2_plen_77_part_00
MMRECTEKEEQGALHDPAAFWQAQREAAKASMEFASAEAAGTALPTPTCILNAPGISRGIPHMYLRRPWHIYGALE